VGVSIRQEQYYGMLNIGVRPTIGPGGAETVEVHLFSFEGDLVGEPITVSFLRRLRDERKFGSINELRDQLMRDREDAQKTVAELAHHH
jgi:riboflavin kinase/FMN adenylyltransferase